MKTKLAVGVAACVLLLFAAIYLYGPSAVPAGQPPLLTLSPANFGEFQNAFDTRAGEPRVLLLVSPT